jgi:hypothetical protein
MAQTPAAEPATSPPPAAAAASPAAPVALRPGQLATVVTAGELAERYAVYLPGGYTATRRWPVLYAFDSRRQGAALAELLRPGAERFGYVVVSALDSSNLDQPARNLARLRALWTDSHERLALDDRRTYGAAFSGMVRFVVSAAMAAPGTFAGVLGLNGGFPLGELPGEGQAKTPFFATVGERDFAYYELVDLEERLTAAGVPNHFALFDGSHEHPPGELGTRGIAWLELQAMREGRRPREAALVEALWAEGVEHARGLDAAGDRHLGWRAWQALRRDFDGLHATTAADERLAQLAGDRSLQEELRRREQALRRDRAYLDRVPAVLRSAAIDGGKPVADVLAALAIPEWQRRARQDPHADERRSAERVLYAVYIQAALYLPRTWNEQGEHRRALFMLDVAEALDRDVPHVPYRRAVTWAHLGNKREALRALALAMERGWDDAAAVREEPAFAKWLADGELRGLLARMEAADGAARSP